MISIRNTKANEMSSSISSHRFATCPTVSIIGAGLMGREIAGAAMRAGMTVRLSDSDIDVAEHAVQQLSQQQDLGFRKPLRFVDPMTEAPISVAIDDAEVADADLIIEAVTENMAIKTAILSRIERHVRDETIIVSNSSSLSMTQISK